MELSNPESLSVETIKGCILTETGQRGLRSELLKGRAAGFAGANADGFLDFRNKDLAVADLAGLGSFDDRRHS